jgi:excisionase family DNA binding protein
MLGDVEELNMAITFTKRSGADTRSLEGTPPRSLKLLSVRESAGYARISQQTIRRAIKAGRLKTYRAGRQIRIDEIDLVEFLSQ